ncbi:hypothetical protein EDWATA_01348 [Edwardsiella tarda ATCC 23685]|uniref:Uncharacterized protein n=1 Tax=Edwardsiella tarda ATCC 23685 TaxID=500638 RepID=D4F3N5_EDWTA|nr:hypothetical protein EDWATA_01348 [Edwardsiella tarda ATCC 23685]
MLTLNQPEQGSQLSAILEIAGVADSRNQCGGGDWVNTWDLADTLT